jgi:hypothetical protein
MDSFTVFIHFKNCPMSKFILRTFWVLLLLTGCVSSSHNNKSEKKPIVEAPDQYLNQGTNHKTEKIDPDTLLQNKIPVSLLELPQSQDGEIILWEGFYEAAFKSYCLQPGTPDPSARDAYLQAPLGGYRKDIVETVLRNSLDRSDLEQRNIQLLLWSVVSGSDYNRLSSSVKATSRQLLTSKQVFALQGGVMGMVKTFAASFPETGGNNTFNDMRKLFELGTSSYEAYERLAVLRQPSIISHADYKRDQWYQQEGGYYVRYYPESYQRVKIQVYVPAGSLDAEGKRAGSYLLFDPVTMMAIPANSNAQRLGIGAPVVEVIRKIINIQKQPRVPGNPPVSNPNSKGVNMK